MHGYDHKGIEKKWQQLWREQGLYDCGPRDATKNKEYVLVEWPYPSGNLHIGHWFAFAVVDMYVRKQRMLGKQVLFPIGFDAFGLPAENAAIKNKLSPKEWTEKNVAYMKKQLESMGNAFSWDKTTSSTDEDYYVWTQWMFTQFFDNDIAYKGEGIVNWCPSCNTVLANEQVLADDTCERCGSSVEKKKMDEWKLRITRYADRLIDDLDALEWPTAIKESQRNWIGRSKGAEIPFVLSTGQTVSVFTTRPDTLFGVTYVAIAPEHPLLDALVGLCTNAEEISSYRREASQKDDVKRVAQGKEKTGVRLQGVSITHPLTKEALPLFVADYVLANYGTGFVMGVPAHDERDFSFATTFTLPVVKVIESEVVPYVQDGLLVNSAQFDGQTTAEAKENITNAVGGKLVHTYRLRDWSIGRQRYWGVPIPIVYDPDGKAHSIPREHLPWKLPTDVDFEPTGVAPLAKSKELFERTETLFGKGWTPEVETMDTFVDSSWYFLRYLDAHNREEFSSLQHQKEWMPVDIYFGGAEHTTMHLLYSRFWQKVLFDLGLVSADEPYRRRVNRGLVLGPDGNKMSKSKGNVIDPDEQVERLGADTVRMYLAFMGPYGETSNYPWDMGGIAGIRRFLEKIYRLDAHVIESESETKSIRSALHKTIQKVGDDINEFKFNTAISAMMVFVSLAEKEGLSKETYLCFLTVLAPFAPHLAEELWHAKGESNSIHLEEWPVTNTELLKEESVTIAIQVNGRVRGTISLAVDSTKEEVVETAEALPQVAKYLSDQGVENIIFVPNKLINFVLTKPA